MEKTTHIPEGYSSKLDLYETQAAISLIKQTFTDDLSKAVNLKRVSAPLFVDPASGMNDNLNGVEHPVDFIAPATGIRAEVVQSLAKWKRLKLAELGTAPGRGIYTDMNALRPDEELDNIHSIYVDQWDWERVIRPEDRNLDFLKKMVRRIYEAIKVTENKLYVEFPQITPSLPEDIYPQLRRLQRPER